MTARSPFRFGSSIVGGSSKAGASIRPVFKMAHAFDVVATFPYARHQHLEFEVIAVTHGVYRCRVDDVPLQLERDQLLVVEPGDWHEDTLTPPLGLTGVLFTLEVPALAATAAFFRPGVRPAEQVLTSGGGMLGTMIEDLARESARADAASARALDAILALFFWRLVRAFPASAISPSLRDGGADDSFASRLRQIVERHPAGALPVPAMAKAMGMSPRSLNDACRTRLGRTPAQAVMAMKMERAAALLSQTDMTVREVGEYLGFVDQFHFSKAFKRLHGVPPSLVRARSRL